MQDGYTPEQQEALREIAQVFKKYGVEIYTEHNNVTMDIELNSEKTGRFFVRSIHDHANSTILEKSVQEHSLETP